MDNKGRDKLEEVLVKIVESFVNEPPENLLSDDENVIDEKLMANAFTKYFYDEWFQKQGNSYLIVFRKNLAETNIQMTELLALLKLANISSSNNKFQGISSRDFKKNLYNLWIDVHPLWVDVCNQIAILEEKKATEEDIEKVFNDSNRIISSLVDSYYCLLSQTIAIDAYNGTAALHIPPSITINLETLCGLSGYIHSCGNLILSRDIKKTKSKFIENRLINYLKPRKKLLKNGNKIAFSIFSHNDKPNRNDDSTSLDSLRMQIGKYYIDQKPLNTEITSIFKNKSINDSIEWLTNGKAEKLLQADYDVISDEKLLKDRIVWLFVEHGLDKLGKRRNNKKYYVFYEQLYRNTSTYFLYDEDKPAWKAHETIPHSLVAAMLNISMSQIDPKENVTINDPFCGSGTTLLETLKFSNTYCLCRDYSEVSEQIILDNFNYFCSDKDELNLVFSNIQNLTSGKNTVVDNINKQNNSESRKAWKLFNKAIDLDPNATELNEKHIKLLSKNNPSFTTKIIFYILYKASYRTLKKEQFTVDRIINSIFFINQVDVLIRKYEKILERHISLLFYEKHSYDDDFDNTHLAKRLGRFSTWVYPCKRYLKEYLNTKIDTSQCIKNEDASKEIVKADIYIADPPYGVNVEKESLILQELYSKMVENMVQNLLEKESGGQIAICLPSETYTGLKPAFYTYPQLLVSQIIAKVNQLGGEVLRTADVVPAPGMIYNLPCYWRAPKTLDRSVLLFRIKAC